MDLGRLEQWRENNRLEVKAAQGELPGDVWPSVSAFANTGGGLIVLGVKENMETHELRILGVPRAQKMLEDFANAANSADKLSYPIFSDEHLHLEKIDGKEVVAIEVPRVDRRHRPVYEGRDPFIGTYRRKFTGDYHCTREEVAAMLRDSADESLDSEIAKHSELEDLDSETVKSYRASYNIHHEGGAWTALDDAEFLVRIGAAAEDNSGTLRPTCAGLLMFGKEWKIVREFPSFFLDYRQQMGENRRWEDRFTSQDAEWSGNVFDFYGRVYRKMRQGLKVPFKLDGMYRMEDTPAHEAMREAIVNMLTNADFRSSRAVVCRWTDEGFEFSNPGGFRVDISRAYRGGTSDARNKTMLKMFTMIDIGERAGSGVPNMVEQWESCGYGRPVLSEEVDPEVSTVFLPTSGLSADNRQKQSAKTEGDGRRGRTEANKTAILAFLRDNGASRSADIASGIGLGTSRTNDLLRELVSAKAVKASGQTRSRVYELLKD